jgi:glycerol-3-phosphate dehydrogenase
VIKVWRYYTSFVSTLIKKNYSTQALLLMTNLELPEHITLSRQQRITKLLAEKQWDIIVIGGGITGAGIFKLAAKMGLKTLLVEQKDFAWGSSSRSSKMVHGGLRYVAQGQFKLTQESVQERQRLLTEAPFLVTKQSFAMSHYQGKFPPPWLFNRLLSVYDYLAGKKDHQYWQQQAFKLLVPYIESTNNIGGTQFSDAMVDDARMVLRLIQEGQQAGGLAINYCAVKALLSDEQQKIIGATIALDDNRIERLLAKVTVNATGAWAKQLLANNASEVAIRPLRGSHLIFPSWRLPVASAITVLHPVDGRPVQIYPWQHVTLVGTTDVEHKENLQNEPFISNDEFDYLLACANNQFPQANLKAIDVISTYAGVRPVVVHQSLLAQQGSKRLNKVTASKEKRDHSIWKQAGLITVAGGKLTTFRLIAQQVLAKCKKEFSQKNFDNDLAIFEALIVNEQQYRLKTISLAKYQYLQGCYGNLAPKLIAKIESEVLFFHAISYSCHLWGQLWWASKYEQVQHLDDLLLRRTRLGNVLPHGGLAFIEQIKQCCQVSLAWSEQKWQQEIIRYQHLWQKNYSLPINYQKKI